MDATSSRSTHKSLNIKRGTFLVPTLALTGLAALGVGFINYNPEDFASAANSEQMTASVSYGDYYLSLSTGSQINFDLETTATGVYSYATDDISVATNAPGYDLYISSADSENAALKLNGTETTTNKIINTSSATGGTTGTATTLAANTYGYAVPSTLACNGATCNSNFDSSYDHPSASSVWAGIPTSSSSDNSKIRSTTAATSDEGDDIDIHYGVYANNALYSGNYTGSVVYTAVANASTDTIATINPTSGEVESTITVTSGPIVANSATISRSDVSIKLGTTSCPVTNVDVSEGYLKTTCTIPSTIASGTYTVSVSVPRYNNYTTNIINGFTVERPPLEQATAAAGITTMQDMTKSACNKAEVWSSINDDFSIGDSRDDNTYIIRKLADGHCWMATNLRLGKTTTMTLSSSDTDITASTWTLPASISSSFDSEDKAQIHVGTSSDKTSDNKYWTAVYGNYYNWRAAVANTGPSNNGDATGSICPKGWKLPWSGSDYSWSKLYYTTYSSDSSNFQNATNTSAGYWSGSFSSSSLYSVDSTGHWWSRTANSTIYAYRLTTSNDSVSPNNIVRKYHGLSVRCVFVGS